MPRLRPVSLKDLEVLLFGLGFVFSRQSASHRIYWKDGLTRPLVVPCHGKKMIQVDTLIGLLKTAHISREEFLSLLGDID